MYERALREAFLDRVIACRRVCSTVEKMKKIGGAGDEGERRRKGSWSFLYSRGLIPVNVKAAPVRR